MSKKNLFAQPGIEQMLPGSELPVGVKVTGRNMHAVSLLVSVSGEALGRRSILSSFFETDGSLSHVEIYDESGAVTVEAGEYMMLSDDKKTLMIGTEDEYKALKAALPIVAAAGEVADVISEAIFGVSK